MDFDVLIADNEFLQDIELKEKIQNEINGVNVTITKNLNETKTKSITTNLLIIDIESESAFEIAKVCKSKKSHVIFTIKDDELLHKAYDLGVYDFIYKPIHFNKLIFKISHYLKISNNEFELAKHKDLSNTILKNISTPIFLTNGERVSFANKQFLALIDCQSIKEVAVKYKNIGEIFEKKDEYLYSSVKSSWLQKLEKKSNQKVLINSKTRQRIYKIQNTSLEEYTDTLIFLEEITHQIEYKNRLTNLLYTDNLTKLPNRAKLIDQLQHNEIEVKAIAIIDINSFKEINDFFGNKIGDHILKEVANIIIEYISEYESLKLYKFPADTYCVIAENVRKSSFLVIIKSIVEAIYKKVFYFEQYEIDTRVSSGISFSLKKNKLITADLALQAAKKDNKDYLVFYDELDNIQEYENNMLWTKKLKNALAKDNIIIYYQPLINNKTGNVDKYECLVRMIDEEKIISPFFFLDISKKSNQYAKITKIVIEKAFKKFHNLDYGFSVNISYEDVENPNFLEYIKKKLKKYNVANKVVFEILEDENIKNYDILIEFINEVKKLGCKVAIDDFGSGYSNFEHILKMNVDFLKIDASLIKNVVIDENSRKITKTITEFAKTLGLKTIAEYVENEEIYNIIRELGVDYSQGYYFSAPIENPEIAIN